MQIIRNSLSKKGKILRSLKQLGSSAQIHGIPRIFQTERLFFKVMWTVFFVFSFGAFTYSFFSILSSYFQYPVVSTIDIISEYSLPFPTVTFCSNNPTLKNYSLNDFIINCQYNSVFDCSTDKYFSVYYDQLQLRRCFRFNSGNNSNLINATRLI